MVSILETMALVLEKTKRIFVRISGIVLKTY